MNSHRFIQLFSRDMQRYGGLSWWLLFRCLPTLVCMMVSFAFIASGSARAQPDHSQVASGQMLLQTDHGAYRPAVMQATSVDFAVAGMTATVTLRQDFVNAGPEWVEGVYAFPLPETAAVRRMEIQIGERRIVGRVRERKEAQKIYQQARQAGKKASLVEQQRPNMFTNRVANIGPGERVSIELEYVQPVAYRDGIFSLRLPTTITPRYIPGAMPDPDEGEREELLQALSVLPAHGWAMPTSQVPDAHLVTPLQQPHPGLDSAPHNPVEISARLDMGMLLASVEAPYHEIALSRRAGVYDISLANGPVEMDRDFVLQWSPVSGREPGAALFIERVDGEYYGLLMLVPPAADRAPEPAPREMVFVVDTSGSMGGVSMRQARNSLDQALRHLRPQDSFNIIEFNSSHRALFSRSLRATRHNVQRATEFVRHLDASGGTEMLPALRAALATPGQHDELIAQQSLRQVIFITDGAVGNETALYEEIVQRLGASRLFTVGIGSAPNSWFMQMAAEAGRGTYTYIADVQEVGRKMDALFRQLSSPVATQLEVDWPDGAEAWPQQLPDLYQGEPLVVAVKLGRQLSSAGINVSGFMGDQAWTRELQPGDGADPAFAADHPGVASLWARKKIAGLLGSRHRGADESAVRAQVLPLALQHQLLSPYTSFIAVEEVVSRPKGSALHSEAVANSRPRGQSPQPFAYPNTATTAAANVWFGALLLLGAVLVRLTRQEEGDA
jgi:Ca-activated chloride channel homolog